MNSSNSSISSRSNLERAVNISDKALDALLKMVAKSSGKKPRIVLAGYR